MHDLVEKLAASAHFHDQVEIASVFKCIMECQGVGVCANTLQDGNLPDNVAAPVTLGSFARENLASILVTCRLYEDNHYIAGGSLLTQYGKQLYCRQFGGRCTFHLDAAGRLRGPPTL